MSAPVHHILCGSIRHPSDVPEERVIRLSATGPQRNVSLIVKNMSSSLCKQIPNRVADLLEIAAYTYAADSSVNRGRNDDEGRRWKRRLQLHVPVRDLKFWLSEATRECLVDLLLFLSGDRDMDFHFSDYADPPSAQSYFEVVDQTVPIRHVGLFSGGLDSLAGTLDTLTEVEGAMALVSHASNPLRTTMLCRLVEQVQCAHPDRTLHIPVAVHKAGEASNDDTQRTRSFLFASLAASTAILAGLNRFFYYENGITSLNLPGSEELVGSRATRTTHPKTISHLQALFTMIAGKNFEIESPLIWKTKADVFRIIMRSQLSHLIPLALTCSNTRHITYDRPHCGRCLQCVDRYLSARAARVPEDIEREDWYQTNPLTAPIAVGPDRSLAVSYVERAKRFAMVDSKSLFLEFPELALACQGLKARSPQASQDLVSLLNRHGNEVIEAIGISRELAPGTQKIGSLLDNSLRMLTVSRQDQGIIDQGVIDCIPSGPEQLSVRYAILRGHVWEVTFDGEAKAFQTSVGLARVCELLRLPKQPIPAKTLNRLDRTGRLKAVGSQKADPQDEFQTMGRDDLLDAQYRNSLCVSMNNLVSEISAMEKEGRPETEIQESRARFAELAKQARSARVPGGGAAHFKSEDANAVAAVRRSLDTFIKEAIKVHPKFGEHLRSYIRIGRESEYGPPEGVTWMIGDT